MSTTATTSTTALSSLSDSARPIRAPTSSKYRSSCDACQTAKVKCSQEKSSCHRCVTRGTKCVYSLSRRIGRPRKAIKTSAPAIIACTASTGAAAATTTTTLARTTLVFMSEEERNLSPVQVLNHPTPSRGVVGSSKSMEGIDPMDIVPENMFCLPSPPSLSSFATVSAPDAESYFGDAEILSLLKDFTAPVGFGMNDFDVDFNVLDTFTEEGCTDDRRPEDKTFPYGEMLSFYPCSGARQQLDDPRTSSGMPLKWVWNERDACTAFGNNNLVSGPGNPSLLNLFPDTNSTASAICAGTTETRLHCPSYIWPDLFSPTSSPVPCTKPQYPDSPCYALMVRAASALTCTPPNSPTLSTRSSASSKTCMPSSRSCAAVNHVAEITLPCSSHSPAPRRRSICSSALYISSCASQSGRRASAPVIRQRVIRRRRVPQSEQHRASASSCNNLDSPTSRCC